MNKICVPKDGIYKIQVNDKGEFIEFDINDIGLGVKCYESLDEIKELEKETQAKIQELIDTKDVDTQRKLAFIERDMFARMREIMDDFLGEGACQKIFGDRNYYSMYLDLFKELSKKRKELGGKSHFDIMGVEAKTINEKIMAKYAKGKENVI